MLKKYITAFIFSLMAASSYADQNTLNVGVPNRIHSLHPMRTSFAQERYILPLIYQPLFQLDLEQNIKPVLADSFQEPNKHKVRIRIKSDQKFQDGSAITSSEVAESIIDLCKNATRGVQAIRSINGCGKSSEKPAIRIISKTEIEFQIHTSANYFLYELASGYVSIFKKAGDDAIGSGQYKVTEIKDGNATLNRIQGSGVNEIHFIYVNDEKLTESLKNEKIDVGSMYRESDLEASQLTPFQIHRTSSYVSQILVLNPKVIDRFGKQRINWIKQKIRILSPAQCGKGRVAATGVVPSGIGGHLEQLDGKKLTQFEPKPMIPRKKITLFQAQDRANTCENEKIKNAFSEMGIDVEFALETEYPALVKHFGSPETDGFIELFTFTRDAARFFDRFTPMTSQPFFYIQSGKIQTLLNTALEKNNITQRFSTYREISAEIEKLPTVIPLYYQGHLSVSNPCIRHHLSPDLSGLNINTFLFLSELDPRKCRK